MGVNEWVLILLWLILGVWDVFYYLFFDGWVNFCGGMGVFSMCFVDLDCLLDVYVYDFNNFVFSVGGNFCCNSFVVLMG